MDAPTQRRAVDEYLQALVEPFAVGQQVVEVAAEKNNTLVLPFPVELLRFLEKATPQAVDRAAASLLP